MLSVLSDGLPHRAEELIPCLYDTDGGTKVNVQWHVSKLRTKLRTIGHEIVCEVRSRQFFYRHVVLLASPIDYP